MSNFTFSWETYVLCRVWVSSTFDQNVHNFFSSFNFCSHMQWSFFRLKFQYWEFKNSFSTKPGQHALSQYKITNEDRCQNMPEKVIDRKCRLSCGVWMKSQKFKPELMNKTPNCKLAKKFREKCYLSIKNNFGNWNGIAFFPRSVIGDKFQTSLTAYQMKNYPNLTTQSFPRLWSVTYFCSGI